MQERSKLSRSIREVVLQLLGEVWSIHQRYQGYPYALVDVVMPVPYQKHLDDAAKFYVQKVCCLDSSFSLKVVGKSFGLPYPR